MFKIFLSMISLTLSPLECTSHFLLSDDSPTANLAWIAHAMLGKDSSYHLSLPSLWLLPFGWYSKNHIEKE